MTQVFGNSIILAAAMTILVPALAGANEPPAELHRNPFDRPAAAALTNNAAVPNTDSTAEGDPYLRAVLVAGLKSVVDFGGVILQIGESADGYRLLSVEEGQATFRNDGKKIVFSVHDQSSGEEL